jgi:hypothetical protein
MCITAAAAGIYYVLSLPRLRCAHTAPPPNFPYCRAAPHCAFCAGADLSGGGLGSTAEDNPSEMPGDIPEGRPINLSTWRGAKRCQAFILYTPVCLIVSISRL